MDNNISKKKDNLIEDIEKDNKFCSKQENKKKNKEDIENQIIKLQSNKELFYFETKSYSLLNGKLKVNLTTQQKKELMDKYWIIKPKQQFKFYGIQIKNIWKNKEIYNIKKIVGILMIFKNTFSKDDLNRFDDYFSIKIKSFERPFSKNSNNGKNFFIGGDLRNKLGEMLEKEFSHCENNFKNNNLPIYISIMTYDEYEKVELDALDLCDTIPEHDGFLKFQKVFHHDFPKGLSNKVLRIKNEKKNKREALLKKENENENNCNY